MSKRIQSHRKRRAGVTGKASADPDDGLRGRVSVIASVVIRHDGTARLVLDDARSCGDGRWAATGLYTLRDYPAGGFEDIEFASDELAAMGSALLSRLVAAGHGSD